MPGQLRDAVSRRARRRWVARRWSAAKTCTTSTTPASTPSTSTGVASPEGSQLLQQQRGARHDQRPLATRRLLAHDQAPRSRGLCVAGAGMRLAGKTAIITGGGSGFGRATAIRFAAEGARIAIADIDEAGAATTAEFVQAAGSEAEVVVGDISTGPAAERVVRASTRALRCGARARQQRGDRRRRTQRDTWNATAGHVGRVVQVNLKSVYLCSRATIPSMLEAGGGAIVNVGIDLRVGLHRRFGLRGDQGCDPQLHPPRRGRARRSQCSCELRLARIHAHADVDRRATRPQPGRTGGATRGFRAPGADEAGRLGGRHRRTRSCSSPATRPRTSAAKRSSSTEDISSDDLRDDSLRGRGPHRDHHVQPARPAERGQPRRWASELRDAYAAAEADDDVWTIVVTGNRAGVLLGRRRRGRPRRRAGAARRAATSRTSASGTRRRRPRRRSGRWRSRSSSAVNGICCGAGLDLVTTGDIVIASDGPSSSIRT